MLKTITLKNKQKKPIDKGFITIEIIIALLIAFGFLMVSLQTLVLAMVFKVGAQEEQRADKLIQEEVERLNDLGSTLALGANMADACEGNADLNGDSTAGDGYGQALWNLRNGSVTTDATSTNTVPDTETLLGKTLTITGTRNATPGDSNLTPHRILGIAYQVTTPDEDGDGADEVIANRYVEVIPDEALECP